jgi:sodium transport system permease protein
MAMLTTLVGFTVVINLPFAEIPGLKFRLDGMGALGIFFALVPVLLPVGALQMLVASRSRSVKEALTAASICSMLPLVPGLLVILSPFKTTTQAMAVPLYGQNLIMTQILRAAPVTPLGYFVAAATTAAAGVAFAALAIAQSARARMLSEK